MEVGTKEINYYPEINYVLQITNVITQQPGNYNTSFDFLSERNKTDRRRLADCPGGRHVYSVGTGSKFSPQLISLARQCTRPDQAVLTQQLQSPGQEQHVGAGAQTDLTPGGTPDPSLLIS